MQAPEQHDWTVYTKSNCVYCDLTKELLKDFKVVWINCDDMLKNRDTFLEEMNTYTSENYRTFPMIFYQGQFMGGYTDMKQYLEVNFNEEF